MIFRLKHCDSTNTALRARLESGEAAVGSCLWSEEQMRGRGRGTNSWITSEGGFYFSAVVPVPKDEPVTWIPLRAALWVAQILESAGAQLFIKWPNDLLSLQGEKFCGILCESVRDGVIVGIGVNQKAPGLPRTTGLENLGVHLPNSQIALRLLETLPHWFGPGSYPLADLKFEYQKRAYFKPGSRVTWQTITTEKATREGTVENLGDWGELVLRDASGLVSLYAEEVSAVRA